MELFANVADTPANVSELLLTTMLVPSSASAPADVTMSDDSRMLMSISPVFVPANVHSAPPDKKTLPATRSPSSLVPSAKVIPPMMPEPCKRSNEPAVVASICVKVSTTVPRAFPKIVPLPFTLRCFSVFASVSSVPPKTSVPPFRSSTSREEPFASQSASAAPEKM